MLLVAAPPWRVLYIQLNDNEIPQGLYLAIAQVLAYIFQLKKRLKRTAETCTAKNIKCRPNLNRNNRVMDLTKPSHMVSGS
jgi:hypothetical protein